MAVGSLVWSGTATVAAGTPGVAGEVDVALASLGATDSVIITPSSTSEQDLDDIKYKDYTFQVIKTASTGFKIKCNQEQNPAVAFDYIVMERSS
jgi:hypothetical protein